MASDSPPYFSTDFMPFSPFVDARLHDNIFFEHNNQSSGVKQEQHGDHQDGFVPLDLTVKSSPGDQAMKNKRKFEYSDSEENADNIKRQRSLSETKNTIKPVINRQLGPLSILPPLSTNPYMNADLLSPLSIAPVPTPFMPLYNMGSPTPPSSGSSASSPCVNLTPPQTPQATTFPTLLPWQLPQLSNNHRTSLSAYPPVSMPYQYNPFSSQVNLMQHPTTTATTTPSPPPDSQEARKVRKILPKPNTSPLSMGSPALHQRLQEPSLAEQTMTINTQGVDQTIHIMPLPSPSSSNISHIAAPVPPTSFSNSSHAIPSIPSAIPPQVFPIHQTYSSYLPYPSNNPYLLQGFHQKQEPKPMSQALSFLFEKSLGSVRRWRENGITIQVFYCAVCDCPTDNEERLRTHIETFHADHSSLSPSRTGVYQCTTCDQTCPDEESLARHKLIHASIISPNEKCKCKGCGRNFATPDSLANHETDCSLYRPYRCE